VGWGYHPPESLAAAGVDALLGDFSELAAALDRLWVAASAPQPTAAT
jgi:phosphoglycolate phosphatase-like HAD superfamily hydrolase